MLLKIIAASEEYLHLLDIRSPLIWARPEAGVVILNKWPIRIIPVSELTRFKDEDIADERSMVSSDGYATVSAMELFDGCGPITRLILYKLEHILSPDEFESLQIYHAWGERICPGEKPDHGINAFWHIDGYYPVMGKLNPNVDSVRINVTLGTLEGEFIDGGPLVIEPRGDTSKNVLDGWAAPYIREFHISQIPRGNIIFFSRDLVHRGPVQESVLDVPSVRYRFSAFFVPDHPSRWLGDPNINFVLDQLKIIGGRTLYYWPHRVGHAVTTP